MSTQSRYKSYLGKKQNRKAIVKAKLVFQRTIQRYTPAHSLMAKTRLISDIDGIKFPRFGT